jgi:hypothetical protein
MRRWAAGFCSSAEIAPAAPWARGARSRRVLPTAHVAGARSFMMLPTSRTRLPAPTPADLCWAIFTRREVEKAIENGTLSDLQIEALLETAVDSL